MRGNLAGVALVFAELVGRVRDWKRGLEGFEMTESQVVNEWISKGELKASRRKLVDLLKGRFPGQVPDEVERLVNEQESLALLDDWFHEAVRAFTFEQFLAVLKR